MSLADLIEARLIEPGESIKWRRPQLGQTFTAAVSPAGEVTTSDDRTIMSVSTAADSLTGGSHNGWERWTDPGWGASKLAALRAALQASAAE